MTETVDLSVCVPTMGREQVLLDTITMLLAQAPRAKEILIIDQSEQHEPATEAALQGWHDRGEIRWIHRSIPSQPGAMNFALQNTACEFMLFLDDDIIPAENLIGAHVAAFETEETWAVVGQVLQPGEEPQEANSVGPESGVRAHLEFPYWSTKRHWMKSCMSGNLSVRVQRALQLHGFDEQFVRVAYRFESEFARRLTRAGGRILYEPLGSIRHLRAARGGYRAFRNHLQSWTPDHSVGDYYFAMRNGWSLDSMSYMAYRYFRSVATKYHLTHPWWIPPKLLGETRGFLWALQLYSQGQKLIPG